MVGGADISMSTPSAADPAELDSGAEGDESSEDSNGELDDENDYLSQSGSESGSELSAHSGDDELNTTQREYLRREQSSYL